MRTTLLAIAAVTFAACGGPGSFSGTVTKIPLRVQSSLFLQQKDSSGAPTSVSIFMGDLANGCDELKANRIPKSIAYVSFTLAKYDSSSKAVAVDVGDYTVTDNVLDFTGAVGLSTFTNNDTSCNNTIQAANANAKSGLIKVSSIKSETGGSISGSFDVTYGEQGDKASGSFDAPFCDAQLTLSPSCE